MKEPTKMTTNKIIIIAFLIATEIILSRFLSIATPLFKIGFAFFPVVIAAIMYGPIYSGIVAAISDILGAMLFPIAGYFPGFTIVACISGIIYGVFLFNKPRAIVRILMAVLVVNLTELVLNTFNIYLMAGQAFWATIPIRAVQSLIMYAVKVTVIYNIAYRIITYAKSVKIVNP